LESIRIFYEKYNANVHRAAYSLSQEASILYENAHKETAKFINAKGIEEIIFVKNTTEAINLLAYSLDLNRDDEVVLTLLEHHSNIVPWEMLSKIKGFKVKYADIHEDGTLNYESLEHCVNPKTKIVSISHMPNVTGVVNDLEKITKIAHDNHSLISVDAAQSAPRMPIDVKKLDVDFLVFSGHKMLAPTGIGVLFGKQHILEKMKPFLSGGDMIKEVRYNTSSESCEITLSDLPWVFEAGTSNISGGVGLMEAIHYLSKLGMDNVLNYERDLTRYALCRLKEIEDMEIYGSTFDLKKGGIISFNIKSKSPHEVSLFLDQFGIMARSGYHCAQPLHEKIGTKGSVRISFYIYNIREEIDRLIDILKEIKKI
jgi:cysteine desulfurase/selenocysteine lyase